MSSTTANKTPKMNNKMRKRQGKPNAKKRKNDSAKQIAVNEGQRGIDSRSASANADPVQKQFVSEMTDVSVDSVASFSPESLKALSLGIVLSGIKKGWLGQGTDALGTAGLANPYFAFVKLYQSFVSAMNGSVPTLQSAPRWYWNIVQALNPKILSFKTGRVSLKWNVPVGLESDVPDWKFNVQGYQTVLGIPQFGNGEVNGFLPIIAPDVYTDDLGSAAIKSLFSFYKEKGMTELVSNYITLSNRTGSAFAVAGAELGNSAGNSAGIISTVYSETQINMPIYSKLALYQPDDEYRGWQRLQISGGSACYVIPRMTEMDTEKELYNTYCPQFKYYNFDEFYEVLSLSVGTALETLVKTQIGAPLAPCPLTVQQVKLILRHTLMRRFYNHFAQDLQFNGNGLLSLIPLTCGVNGSSTTQTSMLFPTVLAENIRACCRKKVKIHKNSIGVIDYIPILARPSELPEPGNYSYETGSGPADLYATDPDEVPIDVIDLSFVQGGTKAYVTLEGDHILTLVSVWNDWIKGLSSYLTPLVDPGTEQGISALITTMTTLQQRYVPEAVTLTNQVAAKNLTKQNSKKKILGIDRVEFKKKHLRVSPVKVGPGVGNYFESIRPSALTTTNTPLEPLMKYTKLLIAPAAIGSTSEPVGAASPAAQQIFRIEPYKVPMSGLPDIVGADSNGTQNLFSRHLQLAILDVKSSLAAQSEPEQDFANAAKQGRGGFFANLAGMFAEDVIGIKGGRAIAGAIGDAVGL